MTLIDTHPPIWQRILVPGNTSLLKLHDILQMWYQELSAFQVMPFGRGLLKAIGRAMGEKQP